jgi:hypothetical protein
MTPLNGKVLIAFLLFLGKNLKNSQESQKKSLFPNFLQNVHPHFAAGGVVSVADWAKQ